MEVMVYVLVLFMEVDLKIILYSYVDWLELYGLIEDFVYFIIVEIGDVVVDIEVGFGIDLVGGGVVEFVIILELVICYVDWFEVIFIFFDDGFGLVLLI